MLVMKNKLRFWYKCAQALAVVGIGFWLLETTYFLFLEGWHWRATNPAEVWADYVVQSIFGGVFFAVLMCLLELIEKQLKADKLFEGFWEKMEAETLEGLEDEDLEPINSPFITVERTHDGDGFKTDDGIIFKYYEDKNKP